jgi:hypothetical protein
MMFESGKAGYLYLLKSPLAPAGSLKVGRTSDYARRFGQYPKGSEYIEVFGPVDDCHAAERHLLSAMRAKFMSSDFGREYFVGCKSEVEAFFHSFCYQTLQETHMPWMPVPMDVDTAGGRRLGIQLAPAAASFAALFGAKIAAKLGGRLGGNIGGAQTGKLGGAHGGAVDGHLGGAQELLDLCVF